MPCFFYLLQLFVFSLKNLYSLGVSGCLHLAARHKLGVGAASLLRRDALRRKSRFNNLVNFVGDKFTYNLAILGTRNYSTNSTSSIHPQFITGFSDAEASFLITFIKSKKSITGYYIQLSFQMGLHSKDRFMLELIKSYFGVGSIFFKRSKDLVLYQVTSIKDLAVIVCQFNKYPLITQKRADFELFQMAFNMINKKVHLSTRGFTEILSLKASLNNGLSRDLLASFPDITPYLRPQIFTQLIKDPQ